MREELAAVDAGPPFMAEHATRRLAAVPGKRGRVSSGAAVAVKPVAKRVLVVDVGGNSVKILASGHKVRRSFPSGRKMTPKDMVGREETHGGLALRRGVDRLSRPGASRQTGRGAAQPRARMGRLRFCARIRLPGESRQ